MECPKCQDVLCTIEYEGIEVETCPACGGEWIDTDELGKVVKIREVKFNEAERRAIAESTTFTGVKLADVDRDLTCPKCGATTDPVNYGGETGIIVDRCASCGGFWLDAEELEKVQMLVEGWEDMLPEDLAQHGQTLRDIEVKIDQEDDAQISRLPRVGRHINAMINGILDMMDR